MPAQRLAQTAFRHRVISRLWEGNREGWVAKQAGRTESQDEAACWLSRVNATTKLEQGLGLETELPAFHARLTDLGNPLQSGDFPP